jgi:hypothetical protein
MNAQRIMAVAIRDASTALEDLLAIVTLATSCTHRMAQLGSTSSVQRVAQGMGTPTPSIRPV